MFDDHFKYYDRDNPEDVLQSALHDPDGTLRIMEEASEWGWKVLELEKKYEAALADLQGAEEKREARRAKAQAARKKGRTEKEDDWEDDPRFAAVKAYVDTILKDLAAARAKREALDRAAEEDRKRREEWQKEKARIDKNAEEANQLVLKDRAKKWAEKLTNAQLIDFHFVYRQRDERLPSRKPVLDAIYEELQQRDYTGKRRRGAKSKSGTEGEEPNELPPTRRTEVASGSLLDAYVTVRRAAQVLSKAELLARWEEAAEALDSASTTLAEFLVFKAHANELIARCRIEERGPLGGVPEPSSDEPPG